MATTPKLPTFQPRVDRDRADAAKTGRPDGDGTGVDIRSTLPPIYRDQGRGGQGDQGRSGNSNTQLAKAVQGTRTGLFPAVGSQDRTLFNRTSPASYHEAEVAAARWVPASATEQYRPRWMKKYSSLGGGRAITFNTPAFTAANPGVSENPSYDIPEEWTSQLKHGLTEARVNDVTDGRPMPYRTAVYNLGGIIRA